MSERPPSAIQAEPKEGSDPHPKTAPLWMYWLVGLGLLASFFFGR